MQLLSKNSVSRDVEPIRLLDFLIRYVDTLLSRNSAKKAIKNGLIIVDGVVGQSGQFLNIGQIVEHYRDEKSSNNLFEFELDIIFEDDYLAMINKPAGLSVSGNYFRTVQNALEFNLIPSLQKDAIISRPVHRLDNQTSGLLLIAKTQSVLIELGKQFECKQVQKIYNAIVLGVPNPKLGVVNFDIEDKKAISDYEVIEQVHSIKYKFLSLVELKPLTGRTHQLRIHMSSIGHPILGDKLYTKPELLFKGKGLFLSATGIQFIHPIHNIIVKYNIAIPDKFKALLSREEARWLKINSA